MLSTTYMGILIKSFKLENSKINVLEISKIKI